MITTKELIDKKLIWKNDDNSWSRHCFNCNNIVNHKGPDAKWVASDACRKEKRCIKCNSIGRK